MVLSRMRCSCPRGTFVVTVVGVALFITAFIAIIVIVVGMAVLVLFVVIEVKPL